MQRAMDEEIEAIKRNNTWELTDLPKGHKTIGVKWVYKIKLKENDEVDKYKVRLVAKGYKQEFDVDYKEVFAPVARHDTIRLVVSLAAQNSWLLFQLDVKSAFLYGQVPNGELQSSTRPDIMHVVSIISRYVEFPTEMHLLAAKRIFRYLQGTSEYGLFYKKGEKSSLVGFTDSDYAGDLGDRKSTSVYVFMMSSVAISWCSKKQPIVTLSTTEAKFVATTIYTCQAI
ncbi:Retrovirus-related Pol polyprotein from transposon TNT 1-94 [Cucumis melo var. makuwa]|uniref:Retrovirus-related Pol polyprotein from transposon TNT 1-94 n=1 Tax=Cucumis melo var. makuwa TaxID=1194695 RepID=A0A5D3DDL5_CUCMM|nr:Retrovirus-related Pol polyprotein from transposon TNT 1-94 [Cucumis melo var. makuwa]TYK21540.1 Retrovirus-related Pol polyprotein from transposon TNT 1-94 [Cucumis melo var. makuwa]